MMRNGDLSNTVVYAGATPGSHIMKLSDMFPKHKFILYDQMILILNFVVRNIREKSK